MDEVEFVLRDSRDIDEGEDSDFNMMSMEKSLTTITSITDLLTAAIAGDFCNISSRGRHRCYEYNARFCHGED